MQTGQPKDTLPGKWEHLSDRYLVIFLTSWQLLQAGSWYSSGLCCRLIRRRFFGVIHRGKEQADSSSNSRSSNVPTEQGTLG